MPVCCPLLIVTRDSSTGSSFDGCWAYLVRSPMWIYHKTPCFFKPRFAKAFKTLSFTSILEYGHQPSFCSHFLNPIFHSLVCVTTPKIEQYTPLKYLEHCSRSAGCCRYRWSIPRSSHPSLSNRYVHFSCPRCSILLFLTS